MDGVIADAQLLQPRCHDLSETALVHERRDAVQHFVQIVTRQTVDARTCATHQFDEHDLVTSLEHLLVCFIDLVVSHQLLYLCPQRVHVTARCALFVVDDCEIVRHLLARIVVG